MKAVLGGFGSGGGHIKSGPKGDGDKTQLGKEGKGGIKNCQKNPRKIKEQKDKRVQKRENERKRMGNAFCIGTQGVPKCEKGVKKRLVQGPKKLKKWG